MESAMQDFSVTSLQAKVKLSLKGFSFYIRHFLWCQEFIRGVSHLPHPVMGTAAFVVQPAMVL